MTTVPALSPRFRSASGARSVSWHLPGSWSSTTRTEDTADDGSWAPGVSPEERGEHTTAAIVQAVMMTLVPVTVYLVVSAAASGRLPRNRRIGLRTSANLSSPMAWRAGHAVALHKLRWYVFAGVTGAGLLLGNLLLTGSDRAGFLPRRLLLMMLVTIFQAAARGVRAAALVAAASP
ncbi:hypothetical protein [Kocuria rosea]|jgi:hypothetical protein|uniref:hypothetical protein n=1 Tax=Kocuria rosea TaxID=1275 RepID=UPI00203C1937|nr:hypothetical protein [Kocuria rosea]MCM3687376.1 hypothetical protein [Kocuria rosea]